MALPILFRDDSLVVVNKTPGLLVHRSAIDRHANEFALQRVRDQIGRSVYPVHRLDRPTSGVLVFALSPEGARELARQFAAGEVEKTYLAVVRGTPPVRFEVDHALNEELDSRGDAGVRAGKPAQAALTRFARLAEHELKERVDKYPTSRYSLVRAWPRTGRRHQIRRHLRHCGHPIIGDVNHGSGKHNRYFRERLGVRRLLLACTEMAFRHPREGETVRVSAPLDGEFRQLLLRFNWEAHL